MSKKLPEATVTDAPDQASAEDIEQAEANAKAEADAKLAETEGSNLTPSQLAEAEQQAITENAVNRATEAFVDSHKPSVREEPQADEEQEAYDAQDKPKVATKRFEHEGVKVSYPSDLSRSQAFLYLTHITNAIMSGAD